MFTIVSPNNGNRKIGSVGRTRNVGEATHLLAHEEGAKIFYDSISDAKVQDMGYEIEMARPSVEVRRKHSAKAVVFTDKENNNRTFAADEVSMQKSHDVDYQHHNISVGDEKCMLMEKAKVKARNTEARKLHEEFYSGINKASNIGQIESERRRRAILAKPNDPFAVQTTAADTALSSSSSSSNQRQSQNIRVLVGNKVPSIKLGMKSYEKIHHEGERDELLWRKPHSSTGSNDGQSVRKPAQPSPRGTKI
jgi:hypothetical protein